MLPGADRHVRERANGWAIYWYASRGADRTQIACFKGATRAEAEAAELEGGQAIVDGYSAARDRRPALGQFGRVIADYQSHPAYTQLRKATRATYRVWLARIQDRFGALAESEITPTLVGAWRRDVLNAHGARAADHALRIFSRVWSFGAHPERQMLSTARPHEGFESLYRAPPQEAWTREDLAKIAQITPEPVRWALMLAFNSGLRRADLVELPWSAIDTEAGVIRWVTSKGRRKGRRIVIPLTPALRATLAAIPKRSPIVLTHKHARPWTVNGLAHAVTRALKAAGIEGSLHGLRRAAATQLAAQGLSSRKIARVMGWGENDAEAMAAIYVSEDE